MRVFVLLFNARTENEGIHTIQSENSHKVLMFESEDDATRFALMLEAQDFPSPTVEALDSEEVEEFCRSVDYEWELVEAGKLAMPPEMNVEKTSWSPEAKPSESEMTNEQIEKIRRQLEGLL